MSRLDELIAELCPDGVEFKTLGEVSQILRGASPRPIKNYITEDSDGVNWIKIGDVAPGSKYITETKERISKAGAAKSRYVKPGDFILSNSMSFGRPYILKIDGCIHDGWLSISGFEKVLQSDFLYYMLVSTQVQQEMSKRASFGGAVQNLNADIVRGLRIPVPPLPVQQEIVRILDHFTELTEELQKQLDAELTARKKQYEYLSSMFISRLGKSTYVKLDDTLDWITYGFTSPMPDSGNGPWKLTAKDIQNGYIDYRTARHTTRDAFDRLTDKCKPICGDVLLTKDGTLGRTAIADVEDVCINQSVALLRPKKDIISSKFLCSLLRTPEYQNKMMQNVGGGTIKHIYITRVNQMSIPLPPLIDQEKAAEFFETLSALFMKLVNTLSAEIAARQKQYEYYRDKLLTFKELKKS